MIYGNSFLPEYIQLEESVILSEVYFGKTEEMQRLENAIRNARYAAREKRNNLRSNDKSIIQLCKTIESIFGFHTVGILLSYTNIADISCFPIGRRIGKKFSQSKMKENLIANEKTFKFNRDANYNVLISMSIGILINSDYTDGEVTAALLHEIGHNFADCFNPNKIEVQGFWAFKIVGSILNIFMDIYGNIMNMIKNNKEIMAISNIDFSQYGNNTDYVIQQANQYIDFLNKQIDANTDQIKKRVGTGLFVIMIGAVMNAGPVIDAAIGYSRKGMNKLGYNVSKLFGIGSEILQNIAAIIPININNIKAAYDPKNLIKKVISIPVMVRAYRDEKLADKFVAVYGYSTELGSMLNKLNTSSTGNKTRDFLANNNNFIGLLYNTLNTCGQVLFSLFDEHPVVIDRLISNVKALEEELMKTDLQEEQKKAIYEDIEETKKIINQMMDTRKKFNDNFIAKKAYYALLYKVFGGDPRSLLIGKKGDDMDQVYNDALVRSGKNTK